MSEGELNLKAEGLGRIPGVDQERGPNLDQEKNLQKILDAPGQTLRIKSVVVQHLKEKEVVDREVNTYPLMLGSIPSLKTLLLQFVIYFSYLQLAVWKNYIVDEEYSDE